MKKPISTKIEIKFFEPFTIIVYFKFVVYAFLYIKIISINAVRGRSEIIKKVKLS